MSWQLFCKNNNIPPVFQEVSIENLSNDSEGKKKEIIKQWIADPHSLVIFGKTGRGKTAFMHTLIREALKVHHIWDFRFEKAKSMDDKMLQLIQNFGTCAELTRKLCDVKYLFLDDLGTERLTERAERELCSILDYRYDFQYKTIITTNLEYDQMEKIYGQRIFSRLGNAKWVGLTSEYDMRHKR